MWRERYMKRGVSALGGVLAFAFVAGCAPDGPGAGFRLIRVIRIRSLSSGTHPPPTRWDGRCRTCPGIASTTGRQSPPRVPRR